MSTVEVLHDDRVIVRIMAVDVQLQLLADILGIYRRRHACCPLVEHGQHCIVNIIRHQLKKANERRKKSDPDPEAEYPTPYWSEIVDIMKTQKVVKSEAINTLGEKVDMLICSTPIEEAAEIYSMLNYKPIPFRRIKIRRTQQT